ncbi:sensor histidine kinase [Streptomyces sp. NPDC051172]|uniref:sensor histidine kinase n=1 Tax=Streptomyces sp. NPDC051172 TaxID=3155796 RepID=UPI003443E7F1
MKLTGRSAAARAYRPGRTAQVLALLCFTVGGSLLSDGLLDSRTTIWPGAVLSAVACLALFRQADQPRLVVLITTACTMAEGALGYLLTPLIMAPMMAALYLMGARADRLIIRNWSPGTALAVGITTLVFGPDGRSAILTTVNPMAWALLPAAVGSYVRVRRAYIEEVHARAEHAERTREEEARHRVAQERMRIARELHDAVAHHLALANAQASTAAHLTRTRPETVGPLLDNLAETTASALRELKAAVGLLRQDADTDTPLVPAPGLERLDELTDGLKASGLDVDVTVDGTPRRLSAGTDLTAFRILQEALTNVAKHAPAATAHVRITYAPDRLTLTVINNGSGTVTAAPVSATGFGLIGMRERAHSLDGTLKAGPRSDGGFEVTCEMPLPSPADEETHS